MGRSGRIHCRAAARTSRNGGSFAQVAAVRLPQAAEKMAALNPGVLSRSAGQGMEGVVKDPQKSKEKQERRAPLPILKDVMARRQEFNAVIIRRKGNE